MFAYVTLFTFIMTDLSISYRNPTQQKEYYMLLLKSCKGAGCVELIQRLLSEPGLFVFEEFLQVPVIREVSLKNIDEE
jgi:hypothetical protein